MHHNYYTNSPSDLYERRMVFQNQNGSSPATAEKPPTQSQLAANEQIEMASAPERLVSWFGRRLKAASDLPGHVLDHALGATSGALTIGNGTVQWAGGNLKQGWEDVKILGRTFGGVLGGGAQEIKRGSWDVLKKTGEEIRSNFKNVFSLNDTSWKNFWYKKPWQVIQTSFSPITGLVKGEYQWISGKGTEAAKNADYNRNILSRTYSRLAGNEKSGVKGIVNGVRSSLRQIYIGGPIETQLPAAVYGVKQIIADIRNLFARTINIVPFPGVENLSGAMLNRLPAANQDQYEIPTQHIAPPAFVKAA